MRFNKHATSLTTLEGRHLSEKSQLKRFPEFKIKYFMRIRRTENYLQSKFQ